MLVASYHDIALEAKEGDSDFSIRPIILSLRYYAFHKSPINPYLTAGAGISRNKREVTNTVDERWTKFAAQGGVGIEFFITPTASIGAEGLYHHVVATADESPLRMLSWGGTANFYFGTPESTKEARSDARKAREEADAAKAEQERLRQENAAANAAASSSQLTATEAQAEAARQAAAAAAATAAATEAERRNQEMEAQTQAAQAEVQQIQDMIARKEVKPVMFATGSDKLLPSSNDALDQVSAVIAKYPQLKLRVEGHTDSVGDDASNMRLSQRRADSVKTYLTGKASGANIEAVGFGESKPVASNDTTEGRAQNRRVEFIFGLPN
jgi:outer membrane protein OmpA-like peptidoglycan-associated protein